MFEFHKDKQRYFEFQYRTTAEYIIPFLEGLADLSEPRHILEIGSAEAGVLKAFSERGHDCTGIELSEGRVRLAEKFMEDEVASGQVKFIIRDIHDIDPEADLGHRFDLILLKDVIEHIHRRPEFLQQLHNFLKPGGLIFFGFPPWQMPFGGHQQICRSKVASAMPYYHLLPAFMYKGILKLFREREVTIDALMEIKETGISIEAFERLLKQTGYRVLRRKVFFTNPIYKYKFRLKVRRQWGWLSGIPWVRNFFSTAVYYVVGEE